jgi:hypothetical protein
MRTLWAVVAFAIGTAATPGARANCAMPVGYQVTVADSKVTVCLQNFGERSCPDDGLLRRSSGGEAWRIASCDGAGCFVDECVPPGDYEYGLQKPYACHSSSCSTEYYEGAKVSAALGSCTRSDSVAVPTAYTDAVPWAGKDKRICGYGMFGCSAAGLILPVDAAALALGLGLIWRARRRRA